MNISSVVYKEVSDFKLKVVDSFGSSFSQYNTIRRIAKYVNNNFWDCPDPNAIFWNISNSRRILFAKSIDLDTKDFQMFGIGKDNWFKSWILNVLFRKWCFDNKFSMTLDETTESTATYGSSVWKKSYKNKKPVIKNVNLQNLYFDPTAEYIIDTPVVELHYLSEGQLRKKYPDKIDEILQSAELARDNEGNVSETTVEEYEVWERWGEFKADEDKDYKYMHFIGVGKGAGEVILLEEEIATDSDGLPVDFPYYDFHIGKYEGRWLRIGVVERLFVIQERVNTIVNQNAIITELSSLPLFRTNDPNTQGNVLMGAVPGQIINSADLAQMPINNIVFNQFLTELQKLEQQANELCFVNESISGETPPSGTPFRSLAVSANAAKSTFKYIKSAIGENMALILEKELIPDIIKDWKKEDIVSIKEDENDIRMFDRILLEQSINTLAEEKTKAGKILLKEDVDKLKEEVEKSLENGNRNIKIEKDFFNLDWGIVMNPTGETVDKNTMNANIDSAIQDMIASPAVVNTPIYQQKLENNGIPPFRLTIEEQQAIAGTTTGKAPAEPTQDKLSQMITE